MQENDMQEKENQATQNLDSSADEQVLESSASESQAQTDEVIKQAFKELEEKYVRIHADFENTKKRLERDKNQALEYAHEKIVKDLLPILDALESAKEAAKDHPAILEGITHTKDNFLKVLHKYGVEEIPTDGEFDPNLHECIMQVAKQDAQDGQIAQVMQKGYKYKERTLRPAMVAVVKNN